MTETEGRIVVELARASIAESFGGPRVFKPSHSFLEADGACFVTLRKGEQLRGCIGSLRARRSLYDDVVENAKASAFEDPRFDPLEERDLAAVSIEVSVLTPMEAVDAQSEEELLRQITPGVHGVHLSWAGRGALFIPAMWEQLPDAREFLFHLRRKAGLPKEWLPGMRAMRFTAEKFEEADESASRPLVARAR